MYRVIKVLNNNSILALSSPGNEEVIILGKGIGFGKRVSETIKNVENAKIYTLQKKSVAGEALKNAASVKPEFLEIANDIIIETEKAFGKVDNTILLPLADHIAFAIERMKKGLTISNPLNNDIKALFKDEYDVALKGKEIIKKITGFIINDDEVGYITLHILSALDKESVSESIQIAIAVRDCISSIEEDLDIKINISSLSYSRLMTHIKYMVARAFKGEKIKLDMNEYMKSQLPHSYAIASDVCKKLSKRLKKNFDDVEIGYLALHIERVYKDEQP